MHAQVLQWVLNLGPHVCTVTPLLTGLSLHGSCFSVVLGIHLVPKANLTSPLLLSNIPSPAVGTPEFCRVRSSITLEMN